MGFELFGEKILFPSTPVPGINNDLSLTRTFVLLIDSFSHKRRILLVLPIPLNSKNGRKNVYITQKNMGT